MLQRMQACELLRYAEHKNKWQETVAEWTPVGRIRVALSDSGGSIANINDTKRIKSTHRGLTYDSVRTGDRLICGGDVYKVDYVIDAARMRQLYLTKEEKLHEHEDHG